MTARPAPAGRSAAPPAPKPSPGLHPPPVHFLQLCLLLPRELLQLQPLAGPELGQLRPDVPVLLLRGCQSVGELLAEHLGQVAPLAGQLLIHLGRHEGVRR